MEKTEMNKVKWNTPDSIDGERSIKQHAFISAQRKSAFWEEPHKGNKSLCSNMGISDDGHRYIPLERIESEPLDESKACKKCLRSYLKQKEQ